MNQIETQELISALADGQLDRAEFARGVEAVTADPHSRQAWLTYHLIGDVLRSEELAQGSVRFAERLRDRLAKEPSFAIDTVARNVHLASTTGQPSEKYPAANDPSFRWKLVAGFASMAAVAAIGWTVVGTLGSKPEQAQLAATPAASGTVLAAGERGTMLRDARLDELLAAHRQLGAASAFQTPAGFLRNANFEGPVR
ncbi:MAG: anti-sigma factor [Comamonadaceae bacterium]|nr:MAG: anti-sigma factor [Comamonadaceae bacterium]